MRFYLIGPLRLESESAEQQIPPLPRLRKTQGLLAYLLLLHNQFHSRDKLASLFWSEVPQERTLPNLSLALNQIRTLLTGSGADLRTDRFTVRLDLGSAWLDVAMMECGLAADSARARRAEALRLYTADLLEGWNDDWCIVERERLRNMVLHAGTSLVREHLAEGNWVEGVSLTQLLLEQDPLNDTLQDLNLRLLLGSGDHAEARRQYQRFASLLRSEMDLDPALSTRQLYALAVQATHSQSTPLSGHSHRPSDAGSSDSAGRGLLLRLPFVGRVEQRHVLRDALSAVRKGHGGLLLVRGEAGAGKTRLIEEALSDLPGLRVARGRAYESGHDVPYAPLLDSLSKWLLGELAPAQVLARLGTVATAALTQILPALSAKLPQLRPLTPLPPDEAQVRLMQSVVTALLSSVSAQSPGVLFLDDLQWADAQTLQVLEQLLTQLDNVPLLVIGSFRGEEATDAGTLSSIAARLQRAHRLAVLDVALLTRTEVHDLIEPRMSHPTLSGWLYERSGGNAFYLAELLRGLTEGGTVIVDPTVGGWRLSDNAKLLQVDEVPLFPSVQEMVMSRFRRMSETGQLVGRVLSVAGEEVDFESLLRASGLPEEDSLTGLEEGLSRRFFVQSTADGGYLVAHDLIRQAIYNTLSAPRRSRLHEQVGRVLETAATADGPLETALLLKLAYHYSRSTNKKKQREYLLQAAEAAQAVYMNNPAMDYYNLLLPLLPPSEQIGVMLRLGEVQQLTGQVVEAEENFQRAAERAEQAADLENVAQGKLRLADLIGNKGRIEDAIQLAQQAHDIFAYLEDTDGVLQSLDALGGAYWGLAKYSEAETYLGRQVQLATETGNRQYTFKALKRRGNIQSDRGNHSLAIAALMEALENVLAIGDQRDIIQVQWSIGYAYLQQLDYQQALEYFIKAASGAMEIGSYNVLRVVLSGMGDAYERYGEHAKGLACYTRYLEMSLQTNNQLGVMLAVDNMASLYVAQGLLLQAEVNMQRVIALSHILGLNYYHAQYLYRQAELYTKQGRYDEARRLNDEARILYAVEEDREYRLRVALLNIRLRVALEAQTLEDAVAACMELLQGYSQAAEEALIFYTAWLLDPSLEEARSKAAILYKELYAELPSTEYRQRYAQLTGVHLPDPPPLPELPEIVTATRSDLDKLLTSVDTFITLLTRDDDE
jgi:predicted ATPase/DNA-binding SARP family transcriptional activator